jgi:hypothetical protein
VEITVYKADFTVACWYEYCVGCCDWLEGKTCLLFNQKLKMKQEEYNAYDEMPDILRCKSCVTLCANLTYESEEVS